MISRAFWRPRGIIFCELFGFFVDDPRGDPRWPEWCPRDPCHRSPVERREQFRWAGSVWGVGGGYYQTTKTCNPQDLTRLGPRAGNFFILLFPFYLFPLVSFLPLLGFPLYVVCRVASNMEVIACSLCSLYFAPPFCRGLLLSFLPPSVSGRVARGGRAAFDFVIILFCFYYFFFLLSFLPLSVPGCVARGDRAAVPLICFLYFHFYVFVVVLYSFFCLLYYILFLPLFFLLLFCLHYFLSSFILAFFFFLLSSCFFLLSYLFFLLCPFFFFLLSPFLFLLSSFFFLLYFAFFLLSSFFFLLSSFFFLFLAFLIPSPPPVCVWLRSQGGSGGNAAFIPFPLFIFILFLYFILCCFLSLSVYPGSLLSA